MSAIENYFGHPLGEVHRILVGKLPESMWLTPEQFEKLRNEHAADSHQIIMHGKPVKVPRWQQAYVMGYHYTGRCNRALPTLPIHKPLLEFFQAEIDARLKGILHARVPHFARHVGKRISATIRAFGK